MGVSFTFVAQDGDMVIHGVPCRCKEIEFSDLQVYSVEYGCSYFDYPELTVRSLDGDERASAFWDYECQHKAFDVHMSNSNASGVLSALGFGVVELVGHTTAVDFEARLAVVDDSVHRGEELLALVLQAEKLGVGVGWA